MRNPFEKFQADLVLIADGDIDYEERGGTPRTYFKEKEADSLTRCNSDIVRSALSLDEKYVQELRETYGDAIADIITRGRLRVSVLINSYGGRGLVARSLQKTFAKLIQRNCRVTTYATHRAASAAAELFLEGQKRNLLSHTELFFHRPGLPERNFDKESEMERDIRMMDFEQVCERLLSRAKRWKRKNLQKKIDEAHARNPVDPEVILTGEEACSLGVASGDYRSIDELRAKLQRDTHEKIVRDTAVEAFFTKSRLERAFEKLLT